MRMMKAPARGETRDTRGECRSSRLRKSGRTYDEIAAQTGLSRAGVFNLCQRHEVGGAKALRDAPSGRRRGDGFKGWLARAWVGEP
jgi:hypothetical protein